MRRKTDMDILREHKFLLVGSILLILFGIFLATALTSNYGNYNSLETKEVTITEFKHNSVRGCSYDYICTTDGEKYNISGNYKREQLQELLTEGRTITIRWYKNTPFRTPLLAEEIYVDGKRVVTYDNDLPSAWKNPLVVGVCTITIGISGLFLIKIFLKSNNDKQKKRNERIRKKYGDLK